MSDEAFLQSFSKFGLLDTMSRALPKTLLTIPLNEKVQFLYNYKLSNHLWPSMNSDPVKSTDKALNYKNLGNNAFCSGLFIEALQFYTKSAATALPGSPELAIAFANRSAALYRLERYEACLVDINRALASNYPEDSKSKLLSRKTTCVSKLKVCNSTKLNYWKSFVQSNHDDDTLQRYLKYQMDECEFDVDAMDLNYKKKFYLPNVNFRNDKIPNASEKLEIRFSPEMGRHVVAVEDIKPGEVLAIEKPFVSILLFKHRHSHCSNCYVRCEALIPCESCSTVMFCSQRCRDNALNRFHRTECSVLIKASNFMAEISEKDWLAIRLFLIATKQGEELEMLMQHPVYKNPFSNESRSVPTTFDSKDFVHMFSLVNHVDKRPAGSWDDKLEMAVGFLYILKSASFFETSNTEHNDCSKLTDKELYVGNLLLKFLLSILYNNFVIDQTSGSHTEGNPFECSSNAEEVGLGIYSFNNFFNHACANNVVNHFHKGTNVSYAITPIKAGEQLFINYGIDFQSRNRTARKTWCSGYHFTCHCKACEADWPTIDFGDLNMRMSPALMQKCFGLQTLCRSLRIPLSGYPHSAKIFQYMCDILSSMDEENVSQPNRIYMYWQRRITLFISARANYYESSRDRLLLSL